MNIFEHLRAITDSPFFKPLQKFVITRLALHGKHDKENPFFIYDCFPSYSGLAAETGASRNFVIDTVKLYIELGVLERTSIMFKGQENNYYMINMEKHAALSQEVVDKAVENCGIKGKGSAHGAPGVVHSMHQGSAQHAPKQQQEQITLRDHNKNSEQKSFSLKPENIEQLEKIKKKLFRVLHDSDRSCKLDSLAMEVLFHAVNRDIRKMPEFNQAANAAIKMIKNWRWSTPLAMREIKHVISK